MATYISSIHRDTHSLSKDQLIDVFELKERCLTSQSNIEEMRSLLDRFAAMVPFQSAVISVFHHLGNIPQSQVYNFGCSEAYLDHYYATGMINNDPVIDHLKTSMSPIVERAEVYQSAWKQRRYRDYICAAAEFGYTGGIVGVAGHREGSEQTGVALSLREEDSDPSYKVIASHIFPHIHEVMRRPGNLNNWSTIAAYYHEVLSARERDILNWHQAGKTLEQISQLVGGNTTHLSLLVEIKQLCQKLDTPDLNQASARALHYGITELQ